MSYSEGSSVHRRDTAHRRFEVLKADSDQPSTGLLGGDGAVADQASDGQRRHGQHLGGFLDGEVDRHRSLAAFEAGGTPLFAPASPGGRRGSTCRRPGPGRPPGRPCSTGSATRHPSPRPDHPAAINRAIEDQSETRTQSSGRRPRPQPLTPRQPRPCDRHPVHRWIQTKARYPWSQVSALARTAPLRG